MNTCPVCGYNELEFPPTDNNICSSCGTEFDLHDRRYSHAQLRQQWINAGASWWDLDMARPVDWSLAYIENQLLNIGYLLTAVDRTAIENGPVNSANNRNNGQTAKSAWPATYPRS